MSIEAIRWQDGSLFILDQRLIPARETWIEARDYRQVAEAIQNMALRGAPLIGVAAAYGMALAQLRGDDIEEAKRILASTRPTAVNLHWALERVSRADDALAEAHRIFEEEKENNEAIARNGAKLIPPGANVLTICNTGSLATPGVGTALGVIRAAFGQGKIGQVFACESRPRLQGLRLTAWELQKDNIPFRCLVDSAAAYAMKRGLVQLVLTGADRIAANGDTANKIGTYMLAVSASYHKIPFIVAAPTSTIDQGIQSGESIPIEERTAAELTHFEDISIAPQGCAAWNPAFDVTPSELITNIVTETDVFSAPYDFGGVLAKSH